MTLRLHGIIGRSDDAAYAGRLHHVEHHGGIELLFVPPSDVGRKRFRLTTDRGTDCAVSLDRDEDLVDGALLFLAHDRAIIVRFGEQECWRLKPVNQAAALKLGWNAGNLHWRVRFEGDVLVVLLDAPLDTYRARVRPLLEAGEIVESDAVDKSQTLALLQLGDSAYPAGGFAFSWGLEGLAADGMLANRGELDRSIADQLERRWASMDRILLRQAFRAEDCLAIAGVDRLAEAATPSAEMREGSRRAGRALLGVWFRLDGPLSVAYRGLVSSDTRLGHLAIVQAVVGRDAGLSLEAAELVSGWTLVTGLVSAAVRLGIVGHIEAQRSQEAARMLLADLLEETPPPDAMPASFTPFIDIAVSRGPLRHVRMFTT